jgi:hypothetical protein
LPFGAEFEITIAGGNPVIVAVMQQQRRLPEPTRPSG